MQEPIKVSLTLRPPLFDAFAAAADRLGMPVLDLMRNVLHDHAKTQKWDVSEPDFDLDAYRMLSRQVAEAALRITETEGWHEDITLRAIQACQRDPEWLETYRNLVGGDEFAEKQPVKQSLNMNFGHYVKVKLKARNKTGKNGNRILLQVKGELVKTVTLLVR